MDFHNNNCSDETIIVTVVSNRFVVTSFKRMSDIMSYNGAAVIAMKGKNCVAIARWVFLYDCLS